MTQLLETLTLVRDALRSDGDTEGSSRAGHLMDNLGQQLVALLEIQGGFGSAAQHIKLNHTQAKKRLNSVSIMAPRMPTLDKSSSRQLLPGSNSSEVTALRHWVNELIKHLKADTHDEANSKYRQDLVVLVHRVSRAISNRPASPPPPKPTSVSSSPLPDALDDGPDQRPLKRTCGGDGLSMHLL